jgi:hypothetical protein
MDKLHRSHLKIQIELDWGLQKENHLLAYCLACFFGILHTAQAPRQVEGRHFHLYQETAAHGSTCFWILGVPAFL